MKVIYGIEINSNKVKIAPWKIKRPNLDVLKYIKGSKYPEAEIVKYLYSVIEGQYIEGRQYVSIQLSVAHDVTWDGWYTTPQDQCMKKGEKYLKLCNLDCVNPLWIGWIGRINFQMALTDYLCKVHKRRSRICLEMNSKWCAEVSEWLEHNKMTNENQFVFDRRDVAQALN